LIVAGTGKIIGKNRGFILVIFCVIGPGNTSQRNITFIPRVINPCFCLSGDGNDSMSVHSGMEFSTKDRDNDKDNKKSCATTFKGAWWFNNCLSCNPNGLYLKCKNRCPSYEGVVWNGWHGGDYSLKRIEIKIRANS
jgi:hypothetical protein